MYGRTENCPAGCMAMQPCTCAYMYVSKNADHITDLWQPLVLPPSLLDADRVDDNHHTPTTIFQGCGPL